MSRTRFVVKGGLAGAFIGGALSAAKNIKDCKDKTITRQQAINNTIKDATGAGLATAAGFLAASVVGFAGLGALVVATGAITGTKYLLDNTGIKRAKENPAEAQADRIEEAAEAPAAEVQAATQEEVAEVIPVELQAAKPAEVAEAMPAVVQAAKKTVAAKAKPAAVKADKKVVVAEAKPAAIKADKKTVVAEVKTAPVKADKKAVAAEVKPVAARTNKKTAKPAAINIEKKEEN